MLARPILECSPCLPAQGTASFPSASRPGTGGLGSSGDPPPNPTTHFLLSSALAGSPMPSHGGRTKPAICPDEAPREGRLYLGQSSGMGTLIGGGACLHGSPARQSWGSSLLGGGLSWDSPSAPEGRDGERPGQGGGRGCLAQLQGSRAGIGGSSLLCLPDLDSLE